MIIKTIWAKKLALIVNDSGLDISSSKIDAYVICHLEISFKCVSNDVIVSHITLRNTPAIR